MDVANYREFEIQAAPYQLAETRQWRVRVHIVRHTADQIRSREFGASNAYPTREETVQHCFEFGRRIIDGQATGCSVADL